MLSEEAQTHFAADYAVDVLRNMILNIETRFPDMPARDKSRMAFMIILGIARCADRFKKDGAEEIALTLLQNEGNLVEVTEMTMDEIVKVLGR
jgi:hypothetical protein